MALRPWSKAKANARVHEECTRKRVNADFDFCPPAGPEATGKTVAAEGDRGGWFGSTGGPLVKGPRLSVLRRWLIRIVVVLMVAPTVLVVAYRWINPPITPLMLVRLVEGEGLDYQWVPLHRISPHLPKAVIAAEDNTYCRHNGFDTQALRQEVAVWRAGGRPRGASTISMQTAKNILLWPGRGPVRKVLEAWITPQLELFWSKQRILEVYLNIAEMGPGLYGAEAAARAYFRKPAADLTQREAAILAAILPSPRIWSAAPPGPYVQRRAAVLAKRITQLGPLLDCVPASTTAFSRSRQAL
ncbi:MAG: monofunctional biosynthetic peptidoglycan transglycosylase [Rhodospirillales bacterium]|nr:MAG: monofunctional biosynthetic peptidoglycan transglycosylase [Rhodospirillales bacterium]